MPLPRSLPLLLLVGSVAGYSSYASELPNANNVKVDGKSVPGLGHLRDAGGGQNNQFGLDFAAAGRKWTSALCNEDSDGDGRTNGEELGDPDCTWSKGGTPKFDVGITHPGVAENSNSAVVIDTCEGWAVPANIDSVKIELTMPGYQVPTADTTYTKYTFNTAQLLQAAMGPTASPSETFGVRFSPIVEHENVVHHMLLYGCDSKPSGFDSPSTTGRMACANLRYAWAVGAEDFCMPDGVGVRFSSTLADAWHVLEIHYDNPTGLSNVVDNSGVEITLAASKANVLSYQSVGFLWAGAALASVSIPPKRENYHVYTTCSYNNLPEEGVKAFAYITHAHKLGVKLWTELKRDGKYLYDLGCEGNYDFDLQEFKPFAEHVTIYPTDVITANCVYDSMDKTTVTKGGDETNNEMCINFIMYYPEVNGNTKCMKQAIEEKEALAGIHTCCPGATMGANANKCISSEEIASCKGGWIANDLGECTGTNKDCVTTIPSGEAGYCECTRWNTPLLCGHTPITCAEVCNRPDAPTPFPTSAPTTATPTGPTNAQSLAPTTASTTAPTTSPTDAPTNSPTMYPTKAPTTAPTNTPTDAPTAPTSPTSPTAPTVAPTQSPTTVAPTTVQAPTTAFPTHDWENDLAAPTPAVISPADPLLLPTAAVLALVGLLV